MPTDITKVKPQLQVQDEGTPLTRRDAIDFVGAGVTATDGGDRTIVTIPGSTDTTYDLTSAQNASDVDVTLTGSDATTDIVKLVAGTNITLTDSGTNQITIDAAGGSGASGIFGIADAAGVYTYYSDLGAAIAAATVGQTIQLFTNYTETASVSVFMKNGVNINLNGHTYEYATADVNDTLSDGGLAVTATIFNGTIKRTGSSAPSNTIGVCLKVSNTSSQITLQGVTVIAEDGSNCCVVQNGKLSGGYYRQIGATAGSLYAFQVASSNAIVDNVNVHADDKSSRCDLGKISNSYFRNDGNVAIVINSGEAHNITGYSTANFGILTGTSKLFNSTGISTAAAGIDTGTSSELYNCSGYSTASYGISNLNYAMNCTGRSTVNCGMITGSNSETYNSTAWSSAAAAIFSRGRIVKTSAISTFNNAGGHGFVNVENNDEVIDCYAEVANAAAYGVNAPTTSPYVTGFSGRGMTQLLNLLSNAQSNTEDNFGNILIG
jgi:hypothetical protein